jgi:hypothetical protein
MRALAAFLVAVSISACADESGGTVLGGPPSTTEPSTISVGETVDFSMYTHCGVESTRINGRVWNATDPLYSSLEMLGPPDGWGDPYQDGRLTLQSAGRAVFAALGERVVLVPSDTGEPLRPCD